MASLTDRPTASVAALYAALWSAAGSAAMRWRLPVVVEIAMIGAWFLVRTTAAVDGRAYAAWLLLALALSVVNPTSGLVIFVGSSAFFEPESLSRVLAHRELMIPAIALGVLLRVGFARFRWRPPVAVWLALALSIGTLLGVANAFTRFDENVAWHAAHSWLGNMAGPVVLIVAGAWAGGRRELRLLIVAVAAAVAAATVSIVEYLAPGTVSLGPFEWVGFWKDFDHRLAGTIPSPNALSAQLVVPTGLLLAAVLLAPRFRLRLVALAALLPLILGHYLTYSRAPLLSLYLFGVVFAWRIRRSFGLAAVVVGLVAGAIILPSYLELRAGATGATNVPGSILVATDADRFRAWGTAIAMFRDEPIVGQGYLAYKQLGDAFGDPVLGSPHNEWLRLFAEEGVVVGIVGLLFIAATARSLWRTPGWLPAGILAGFLGYLVASTFNNPLLFIRVSAVAFSIVGVGLGLAMIATSSSEAVDRDAVNPGVANDRSRTPLDAMSRSGGRG